MGKINDIENIEIDKLVGYENNAKTHSDSQLEQIQKSILEFGFLSPCLIDEKNNIIAGHGRTEAAKRLNLKTVPCVRIEGLSEEQRKAYILADNKLTELGGWNKELLASELELLKINDFDINLTGFSLKDIEDIQLKPVERYGSEHDRTVNTYNLDLIKNSDITNDFWQMPKIINNNFIPDKLVGFNYAKTNKDKSVGIHFYLDDYQFERVWNNPEKYLEILAEYDCILSPDFSLYSDMPMPMKIWNVYRSRSIGAFYQNYGINVIPTISWAEEDTFNFCFEGIPEGSIVSVSTIGVKEKDNAFTMWKNGMNAMIDKIKPQTILVYGGQLDFDYGDIDVRYYDNQVLKEWKRK